MRRWTTTSLAVLLLQSLLVNVASAAEVSFDQSMSKKQVCQGAFSKKGWNGDTDPHILVNFIKPENVEGDPIASIVIFEWNDKQYLGMKDKNPDSGEKVWICDDAAVQDGYCKDTDKGTFLLDPASKDSKSQIIAQAVHLKDPPVIKYEIKRTGYYCISTEPFGEVEYKGAVVFRNAYGELPAAQIAKLPFYGALTMVYAFMAIGWGVLYYMHRSDILAVQNYITAILVFLVVEIFMTWMFYDYQNRHGLNAGAKALLIVVSILSAGRNSFSFFLLLIVCMGYGVVKHTLGKTMIMVRALAIAHFVFGVIYAIASLSVTPESAGPLVLLVVLPLAGTLTAFYIWTLNSLGATMKDLMERKQTVKAGMYRKLWWCILSSIIVIFAFFFINSWTFAGVSNEDFVPKHWSTRWFILDGWLNLVYLADVAFVAWVWRPTANNRRFAMSDEIAQDDEGFEIASVRDSLDFENDDLEGGNGKPSGAPPAYDAPRPQGGGSANRGVSPLPAPTPQKPVQSLPRESLDGDTIFAVGDELDKSDDEDSDDEGNRLTGRK
ncbi:lung seven transmembrane receptor-domain-containing protein [Elsinoe ampelina]|uniref:Lung seven transmembrane receptor-domain-containing protein n=1 Tax=Elsinoe ampelina TaxID=302913 RepID=A0A6A6GJS2_9PEZI|nr:lung seven transmembrane receptor-domain-containing protein [Elsinoe ampelina]